MGIGWCKSDPVVLIDEKPAHLTLSMWADARAFLRSVSVTLALPGLVTIPPGQTGRRLFGKPLTLHAVPVPDGEPPSVRAVFECGSQNGAHVVAVALEAHDGSSYFGTGVTGTPVTAYPTVLDDA